MTGKENLLDALTRYRQMQIKTDSAIFAGKNEMRGYLKNIIQTEDGIIFLNGAGEEIAKIPALIKNPNLHGGD